MTDELKTLKDLDSNQTGFYRNVDEVEVFKKRLKAEAIKWVKAYENWPDNNYKREFVKLFKLFFNLTEEDLK